ncbi:MAG: hypothetical protein ACOC95_06800 [Planctomycetota bacterium]
MATVLTIDPDGTRFAINGEPVFLLGAIEGGAAGWCFHNGDNRARDDGRPRRSFDMSDGEGRLFDQLDAEERALLERVGEVARGQ